MAIGHTPAHAWVFFHLVVVAFLFPSSHIDCSLLACLLTSRGRCLDSPYCYFEIGRFGVGVVGGRSTPEASLVRGSPGGAFDISLVVGLFLLYICLLRDNVVWIQFGCVPPRLDEGG